MMNYLCFVRMVSDYQETNMTAITGNNLRINASLLAPAKLRNWQSCEKRACMKALEF